MSFWDIFKQKPTFDSIEGINNIQIPQYSSIKGMASPANNIEYILQRKATEHKKNGRMDLAIACLRKSNEIMPHSNFSWKADDYLRLVKYLEHNGQHEEARLEEIKIMKMYDNIMQKHSKQKSEEYEQCEIKHKKPTELYKVNIESITSMQSYPELPFSFIDLSYIFQEHNNNEKIYLFSGENQEKAKSIILSLNGFIDEAKCLCSTVALNKIKETDLEFNPIYIQASYPFEFFRVNPKTDTGKLTKFPMSIHFQHDLDKPPYWENNIFGDIFLLKNGDIGKASIHQWYKNRRHSIILSYVNGKTIVSRIEQ